MEDKEIKKEKRREYYERNKEKMKQRATEYAKKNKEKIRQKYRESGLSDNMNTIKNTTKRTEKRYVQDISKGIGRKLNKIR